MRQCKLWALDGSAPQHSMVLLRVLSRCLEAQPQSGMPGVSVLDQDFSQINACDRVMFWVFPHESSRAASAVRQVPSESQDSVKGGLEQLQA